MMLSEMYPPPVAPYPPRPNATEDEKRLHDNAMQRYHREVREHRRLLAYEQAKMNALTVIFAVLVTFGLLGGAGITLGVFWTSAVIVTISVVAATVHFYAKRAADRAVPPIK